MHTLRKADRGYHVGVYIWKRMDNRSEPCFDPVAICDDVKTAASLAHYLNGGNKPLGATWETVMAKSELL